MKDWITLKTAITFFVGLFLFYLGFNGLFFHIQETQKAEDAKQNFIILESVKNRFKLFLDYPITIGVMGSDYFGASDFMRKDYGPLVKGLGKTKRELLGLNLMNAEGKIIRVFPEQPNSKAIGLVSQNYEILKKSFEKNQPFWFSPPFQLFQAGQGFAIYFPVVKSGKLDGWFATVMSTEQFARDFDLTILLDSYDISISDKETNRPYYSTGIKPLEGGILYTTNAIIQGRELVFSSWRKEVLTYFHWTWSLGAALICTFFTLVLLRVYEQKIKARNQLDEISMLLKLTSKEALSKLIDLQNEIYKLGSSENAKYITNLIEQIDLLQTTANSMENFDQEPQEILPLIEEEMAEVAELLQKKSLKVVLTPEKFSHFTVVANRWLFKNCVIGNILTHSIVSAEVGTAIDIEYQRVNHTHVILFRTHTVHILDIEGNAINLDRRMKVATKVLQIYGGDLHIDQDLSGGLIIRIILSAS